MTKHAPTGPPWERTYEAINGEPCPYNVAIVAAEKEDRD